MIQIATPLPTQPVINPTQSRLTFADRLDHFLARVGVNRSLHRVTPGLYALGNPSAAAPVFVTANYTLSFDALRVALSGIDGYILVLDTQGINVWCAAGEGTFGTEELVRRIEACQLKEVVSQRQLILPQLGGPGIAAHEVRKRSGFKVEYGPIRAGDLPEYLKAHQATPEMRLVRFSLSDRLTVAVVDVMRAILPMLAIAVVMYFLGGRSVGFSSGSDRFERVVALSRPVALAAWKGFHQQRVIFGVAYGVAFCHGYIAAPARSGLVVAGRQSAVLLADHATGGGFSGIALYRIDYLHIAQRRQEGNLYIYPTPGLDAWRRGGIIDCCTRDRKTGKVLMQRVSEINTLQYDVQACTGCGVCVEVCPHGVFAMNSHVALIVRPEACMECGACQKNCPFGAIMCRQRDGLRQRHDPRRPDTGRKSPPESVIKAGEAVRLPPSKEKPACRSQSPEK